MFGWLKRAPAPIVAAARRVGFFGGSAARRPETPTTAVQQVAETLRLSLMTSLRDAPAGLAEDSLDGIKAGFGVAAGALPEAVFARFASQTFIGHQACAILAQNWLIGKACVMPAEDAIRNGYKIAAEDGELPDDVARAMRRADERYDIAGTLVQFAEQGRIFGIRIALPVINPPAGVSLDAYCAAPFNPDGITPGSYRGIVQIDPQWATPELGVRGASDPTSLDFYNPVYWTIGGRRYHRSHLVIFQTGEVPDVLKPLYRYGGIPVPQRIVELAYGAERSAGEALELVVTKRLNTLGINAAEALADRATFEAALAEFARLRNNYGIKTYDKETEEVGQLDTTLTDLDAVIMTQYQLVAAAAGVPATKLLGTTPKGFNATGEYDEASYHEMLESLQARHLSPLLRRHHLCVMRSEIVPQLQLAQPVDTAVVWNPLDAITATEAATVQKTMAETDEIRIRSGVIDGIDARTRVARDPESGYFGIEVPERGDDGDGA